MLFLWKCIWLITNPSFQTVQILLDSKCIIQGQNHITISKFDRHVFNPSHWWKCQKRLSREGRNHVQHKYHSQTWFQSVLSLLSFNGPLICQENGKGKNQLSFGGHCATFPKGLDTFITEAEFRVLMIANFHCKILETKRKMLPLGKYF